MRAKFVVLVTIFAIFACLGGCARFNRDVKTHQSDFNGGLDRKVTLYDCQGNKMREWDGKIDVDDENGNMMFDLDGKRTIISGGIVLVEEK